MRKLKLEFSKRWKRLRKIQLIVIKKLVDYYNKVDHHINLRKATNCMEGKAR